MSDDCGCVTHFDDTALRTARHESHHGGDNTTQVYGVVSQQSLRHVVALMHVPPPNPVIIAPPSQSYLFTQPFP